MNVFMNGQNKDVLSRTVFKVGVNLLFCATALLAVAHSTGGVAKWGQVFSGLFYALGFIAGAVLLMRHHWRNGLILIVGTLAGGFWIIYFVLPRAI